MENGSIRQLLHNRHVAIVDGAMATELEKHGVDTSGELWSAAALLHQRQAIYDVHMSYLEAGADFATTNTYQANPEAFANIGLSESESRTLIAQAVQEAKRACADWSQRHPSRRTPLVAGSVGPYGAFLADGSEYTGDYALSGQQYQDFHRVRIRNHAEHWRSEGLDRSPTGRIPEHDSMAVVQPVRKWRYGGWHGPGRSRLLHPERAANRSRRRQLRADGPCASSNSGHPTGYGQADHRVSEQR